jgi:hypothetical protein
MFPSFKRSMIEPPLPFYDPYDTIHGNDRDQSSTNSFHFPSKEFKKAKLPSSHMMEMTTTRRCILTMSNDTAPWGRLR